MRREDKEKIKEMPWLSAKNKGQKEYLKNFSDARLKQAIADTEIGYGTKTPKRSSVRNTDNLGFRTNLAMDYAEANRRGDSHDTIQKVHDKMHSDYDFAHRMRRKADEEWRDEINKNKHLKEACEFILSFLNEN